MWDAPEIGIVGPIPVRDGKSIAESTVPAHLLPSMPPYTPLLPHVSQGSSQVRTGPR